MYFLRYFAERNGSCQLASNKCHVFAKVAHCWKDIINVKWHCRNSSVFSKIYDGVCQGYVVRKAPSCTLLARRINGSKNIIRIKKVALFNSHLRAFVSWHFKYVDCQNWTTYPNHRALIKQTNNGLSFFCFLQGYENMDYITLKPSKHLNIILTAL